MLPKLLEAFDGNRHLGAKNKCYSTVIDPVDENSLLANTSYTLDAESKFVAD